MISAWFRSYTTAAVTSLAVKRHLPSGVSRPVPSAGRQSQGSGARLHVPLRVISKGAWGRSPAPAPARTRAGAPMSVRARAADRAASGKPICIFDLDHTLVHTVVPKSEEERADLRRSSASDVIEVASAESGHYRTFFTKLRPGARELLQFASTTYEVWLFSNGRRDYVEAVLQGVVDPTGRVFGGRVIAQGDDLPKPKRLNDHLGLRGMQQLAVVVDDIADVWTADDAGNVLCVEPYSFFPNGRFPSLMERGTDEDSSAGMLAVVRRILGDVIASFEDARRRDIVGEWDVRLAMDALRARVLAGVHIVFSFFSNFNTRDATLGWHAATKFGAVCSFIVDEDKTTHVVSHDLGTAEVAWARARGVSVVTLEWIKCSVTLWRPADEGRFLL